MSQYLSFEGRVEAIQDFQATRHRLSGCTKLYTTVNRKNEVVSFVAQPSTYFTNHQRIDIGDRIIGFYDSMAPVPLIYPPQYQAIVIGKVATNISFTVDQFDRNLTNSNRTLRLNIGPNTQIELANGQPFTQSLTNRTLVVFYQFTTKSIPAQTTPSKIVVLCI